MTVPHLVPPQVSSLTPFIEAGVFGLTEVHLADTLATADPTITPEVLLGAALAARAPLTGSVCVELATIGDTVVSSLFEPTEHMVVDLAVDASPTDGVRLDDDTDYVAPVNPGDSSPPLQDLDWPDVATWSSALEASSLVDTIGGDGLPIAPRSANDPLRPLVLEDQRLYLARYWHLERFVGEDLITRTSTSSTQVADADAVASRISDLFELASKASGTEPDAGQVAAARAVAERNLVVISGGPGTGKTTTVAHLLAGLVWSQADAHAGGATMAAARDRIALVAPTGKAAARMTEAIQGAVGRLSSELPTEVVDQLNSLEAVTIHRLLGRRGAGFRRGPESPLTYDLVIVDEVSMVSLSLMAHLLAAIPRGAKVVLVGDPYQLASVEAGTVLGDIVGVSRFEEPHVGSPASAPRIAPSVRPLTTVHRQKHGSAIVDLATAIRDGRTDDVMEMLDRGGSPDVCWVDTTAIDGTSSRSVVVSAHPAAPTSGDPARQPSLFEVGLGATQADPVRKKENRQRFSTLREEIRTTALAAVEAASVANEVASLDAILSIKVLCALRRGPAGVEHWNRVVEDHLRDTGAIRRGDWYAGRPTMVTENDYLNNVFNGDVGVALRSATADSDGPDAASYRVVFKRAGSNQEVPAIRLDRVVTQWAMSIHKSQGSEFPHAVVVLPPPPARILTRELLYTGVTRAKDRLTLVASEESIRAAVDRPVARASGLAARLA